jgi:hypothetical protein
MASLPFSETPEKIVLDHGEHGGHGGKTKNCLFAVPAVSLWLIIFLLFSAVSRSFQKCPRTSMPS